MFNKYLVWFVVVLCFSFLGLFAHLDRIKSKLELTTQDLDNSLSINAKQLSDFETQIAHNQRSNGVIIEKLSQQIVIEQNNVKAQKKAVEIALKDQREIAEQHSETSKQLSILLNEKNIACINDDLPLSVLDWVQTLPH